MSELFTLDACRRGGMTELEEAELTEGQGRALSGHRAAQAYRSYAKETMQRALAATRKRHAASLGPQAAGRTKRHRISKCPAKSISKWAEKPNGNKDVSVKNSMS